MAFRGMDKADHTAEYEFYCSSCQGVIDEHDKFCRQCGADTSETIDEPIKSLRTTEFESKANILSSDSSKQTAEGVTSVRPRVTTTTRSGLRSAAILLFVMAAFQFANQVINNPGRSGTSSTLPVIANVVIGIGLLRRQETWSMSQNGYRIWAIIRCIALPVFIAIGLVEPSLNVTGAFIMHSPELIIAAGLLTILIGPPPSRKRLAVGIAVSVIGFIGSAILIGLASR